MTDINQSPELELDTTANGTDVVAAPEPAPAAEEPKTEPTKLSLDDALAKAFEKHGAEAPAKPKTEAPEPPAEPAKQVDPITGRESEPMKAPAGWTPLLKEKWGTIDPTVQKFISDREKDIAQTISKTADDRKLANEFKSVMAPFDGTFRQYGVAATTVVKNVMTQWHAMQTGSPQQRAQIVHQIIQQFHPDIPTLQALASGQHGVTSPAPKPEKSVDERVQEELNARQEREITSNAQAEIERFKADPKNEFFDAVSTTMGKIIEAGLVPEGPLPDMFKKAYDLACAQNAEVQEVLKLRDGRTKQARAVNSVKPSLNAGVKGTAPKRKMSLDDAVRAAFNDHAA